MDLSALGPYVGYGTVHEPRAAGHAQALDGDTTLCSERPVRRLLFRHLALLIVVLGTPAALRAQSEDAEPSPVDSLRAWYGLGLHFLPASAGDSLLTDVYISRLAPSDTLWHRRWVLTGGSWLLAQADHRGVRHTAALFLWQPEDNSLSARIVPAWSMSFSKDSSGCWHIVNDTTPISSCAAASRPQ